MGPMEALKKHLSLENYKEIKRDAKDKHKFSVGCHQFLVLSDHEAQRRTAQEIISNIWTFSPNFLAEFFKLDVNSIRHIQSLCENSNAIFHQLLGTKTKKFIERAISLNGRGYFLAHYDFHENQVKDKFIYMLS